MFSLLIILKLFRPSRTGIDLTHQHQYMHESGQPDLDVPCLKRCKFKHPGTSLSETVPSLTLLYTYSNRFPSNACPTYDKPATDDFENDKANYGNTLQIKI